MAWSKFRARDGLSKKIIYGVGIQETHLAYDYLVTENLKHEPVERTFIAQHVAFDKDGKEVYDDDILVDENGNEFKVVSALQNSNTGELLPIENPFRILDYRLKESEENAEV